MRFSLGGCALLAVLLTAAPALAGSDPPRHRIIADERDGERRIVDVVIDERVGEPAVAALASDLRRRLAATRLVVNVHLPGSRIGEVPWASVRFLPEPRIQIIGLTLEEAGRLIDEAHADQRERVGAWLTSSPLTPGRLTIFREGRKTYAEWRLRGGARSTLELGETRSSRGTRFEDRSGGREYFLVTPQGDLEVREADTLIGKGERIPPPQRPVPRRPEPAVASAPAAPGEAPQPQTAAAATPPVALPPAVSTGGPAPAERAAVAVVEDVEPSPGARPAASRPRQRARAEHRSQASNTPPAWTSRFLNRM